MKAYQKNNIEYPIEKTKIKDNNLRKNISTGPDCL